MYSAFLGDAENLAGQLASEDLPREHHLEPELEKILFRAGTQRERSGTRK